MAGNWKMNLNHLEAIAVAQKLVYSLDDKDYDAVDVAIIPPFTDIRSIQTLIDGDRLRLLYGAQDLSPETSGAFTGDISGSMLAKLGCTFVVIGHSERRAIHKESDAIVNKKIKAALANELTPIFCCGETLAQRESGIHFDFVKGDEIVAARQDYPNMVNAYKQREERDGIKMVWISLELPSEDEDYIVRQYVNAFTSRTKVVHITHVINWNGQIIPVKKIADEAHRRGIKVIVDGAHSFAHFDFKIPELGADYFATSLHKWLYAPIGSGMLYVKKEHIAPLYPLFAAGHPKEDNIRKFEALGTRPFFIEQAIGKAIDFHELLGIERKMKRLHYLKNYWMKKVKEIPGVKLNTSLDPRWGCAIGNIMVEGRTPAALDSYLLDKYKVHTVGIEWENIKGIRVTPNVYTTTKDLDVLVEGITQFAKESRKV